MGKVTLVQAFFQRSFSQNGANLLVFLTDMFTAWYEMNIYIYIYIYI